MKISACLKNLEATSLASLLTVSKNNFSKPVSVPHVTSYKIAKWKKDCISITQMGFLSKPKAFCAFLMPPSH